MAETNGNGEGNRATIALVAERLDGLKELTRAEFGQVKEDLKALADVPVNIAELRTTQAEHDVRLRAIERYRERTADWRRGPLLAGTLAVVALVVNIYLALH